jgi:hypothetical protein
VDDGLCMEMANRAANGKEKRLNVVHRCITKHVDQGAPLHVLQHKTVFVNVCVEQGRNRKACSMKAEQDSGFGQQTLTTKTLVKVRMTPSTSATLLQDRRKIEPRA